MDIVQGSKDEDTIEKKSQNKLPAALFPQRQLTQGIAFTLWSITILQSTHNTKLYTPDYFFHTMPDDKKTQKWIDTVISWMLTLL